ncbi:uncharacterized protein V1516DRAFT_692809 [Lipomyces oligophaga]|uniref:uncharacterized protein n=1 Tax=Lipomyces oligophaga TaxID=45792 RepID=UPI0034CDB89E
MGRRKILIRPLKDDRNRSVTFLKRKAGLFKKAHELSVLCSVDIAVIIFGANKKLYEYSSCDTRQLIERYNYSTPHESKGPRDFQRDLGELTDDDGEVDHDNDNDSVDNLPYNQASSRQNSLAVGSNLGLPPDLSRSRLSQSVTPDPQLGSSHSRRSSAPQNHIRSLSQTSVEPQHHAYGDQSQTHSQSQPQPQEVNQKDQQQLLLSRTHGRSQSQSSVANSANGSMMMSQVPHNVQVYSSQNQFFYFPPREDQSQQHQLSQQEQQHQQEQQPTQHQSQQYVSYSYGSDTPTYDTSFQFQVPPSAIVKRDSNDQMNSSPALASRQPSSTALATSASVDSSVSGPPSVASIGTPNMGVMRPKLKLRIPDESQGAGKKQMHQKHTKDTNTNHEVAGGPGSATSTAISSSASGRDQNSAPPMSAINKEMSSPILLLPPPSPSTYHNGGGLGGPGNPFARPSLAPAVATSGVGGGSGQSAVMPLSTIPVTSGTGPMLISAREQTPVSALPGRYMSEFLPSPSMFYQSNDWNMQFKSAGGLLSQDLLPSPLQFQTPVVVSAANSFRGPATNTTSGGVGVASASASGSSGENGNARDETAINDRKRSWNDEEENEKRART